MNAFHAPFFISQLPLVPSGTLALCRMPGSLSPLDTDVEALSQLAPACVLTLNPANELQARGGGLLPSALARRGIAWHHFPIDDYGVPLPEQSAQWQMLAPSLHGHLDTGRVVVIHCLAGLGRAGMVALRLLVERGEQAAEALQRIRTIRPGAVERSVQFDWAAAGEPRS